MADDGYTVNLAGLGISGDASVSIAVREDVRAKGYIADYMSSPATSDSTVASRTSIASTSKTAKEQQLNCAALDALLPIPYGRQRVPGLLANAFSNQNNWYFWIIWCEGELDSFEQITMNDEELPEGSGVRNYVGTPTGECDPTLVREFSTRGARFTEMCPGVAYSVIHVPHAKVTDTPSFHAIVKGRKVYDPRDPTQEHGTRETYLWSDNPSLILADFLEDSVWGAGKTVVWSTVETCADFNDSLVGISPNEEVSRTCNMLIDREAIVSNWIESLRTAASVFLVETQSQVKLVPDTPYTGDPPWSAHYQHEDGKIIAIESPQLRVPSSLPTVIEITYLDCSQLPWQDATTDPVEKQGVSDGSVPYRDSVVDMRWISRASQARREAVERLNKLWLRSLTFNLHLFDEGLTHEPGDIIAVTYPDLGFDELPVRVLSVAPTTQGWMLACEKHDVGCYSDEVQEGPTTPSTNLPLPDDPPAVDSVTAEEEVYQQRDGTWSSRLRISWPAVDWPFVKNYRVTVTSEGRVVQMGTVEKNVLFFVTGTVKEVEHQVDVQVVSILDVLGAAASFTITPLGKDMDPGDVPANSFHGVEAGGKVHLWWGAAVDIDIWRYEIRYGPVGGSWSDPDTVVLDRIDGLTATFEGLDPGDWIFYIAAVDSVRNYSPNPREIPITITFDTESFLISNHVFDNVVGGKTLTNMTEVVFRDGSRTYVTDFGDLIGYGYAGYDDDEEFDDNVLTNKAFNTPHSEGIESPSSVSELLTEAWDIGVVISGEVVFAGSYTAEDGSVSLQVETRETVSDPWTTASGPSTTSGAVRYVRGKMSSTGAFTVSQFPSASVKAKPRTESFTDLTSNVSGPKTITLSGNYAKAKAVLVTPHLPYPPAARTWAVDNIVLGAGTNTFDIYMFDSDGNQVASDFDVQFQGV